jgi:hypothetical protein
VDTSRSGVLATPASAHKLGARAKKLLRVEEKGGSRGGRGGNGREGEERGTRKGIVEGDSKRMSNSRRYFFMLKCSLRN